MPEYLSPGVYIEEAETGIRPIEGVSTSTAGFLGLTERGPTTPRFVTGFEQFQRIYGGFIDEAFLPYAVDGFFRNGGQRCYIGRVVKKDAKEAEISVGNATFTVKGPGDWGKHVGIRVEDGSLDKNLFKLIIAYWNQTDFPTNITDEKQLRNALSLAATNGRLEIFDNLSVDPTSSNYYLPKITGASDLIKEVKNLSTRPTSNPNNGEPWFAVTTAEDNLEGSTLEKEQFLGGLDAITKKRTGLAAFKEIEEISIISVPDLYQLKNNDKEKEVINAVIEQCEELKYRFAVLDGVQTVPDPQTDLKRNLNSKYAAIYSPWIRVFDPLTNTLKSIPPSGHIAGIYARSDQQRGVHKAPANEIVRGAMELEFNFTKGEQDILNPYGVNLIRSFPGRGLLLWGARTTATDTLWKYINVRRLLIYLEESIDKGTQWVVFEPNNERLWARVKSTLSAFLTRVWRDGALMGTKPEEAFFVKIDRTTMTQDDIDNGRLIIHVGVAPVKPAEFVIIRFAQVASGSETIEF